MESCVFFGGANDAISSQAGLILLIRPMEQPGAQEQLHGYLSRAYRQVGPTYAFDSELLARRTRFRDNSWSGKQQHQYGR